MFDGEIIRCVQLEETIPAWQVGDADFEMREDLEERRSRSRRAIDNRSALRVPSSRCAPCAFARQRDVIADPPEGHGRLRSHALIDAVHQFFDGSRAGIRGQ